MSKVQAFRAFLSQRLAAAVEEISEMFERIMAEYEDELRRCKEKVHRKQQFLDMVLQSRVLVLGVDPNPGVHNKITQTAQIKEEPEEQSITEEEEQLPV